MRILYVEDNTLVREVTRELLEQEDREVISLENAEEALCEFHGARFDLVITDVSLPLMSGLDLARSLLRLRPALPIIIASGYALDFGVEQFGPNVRSIIKPFDTSEIEGLIAQLLRDSG